MASFSAPPPPNPPVSAAEPAPAPAIDLDQLRRLPIDTLDTIRSKLVQLVDAIAAFRFQLESSPLTPHSLPYSALISKFLILLNHTEALSQALNTPVPAPPINRFELPAVRAAREEKSKWEDGSSKRSLLGNLAVTPRGLEGLEDSKDWIVGVLTRTKLAPEIEKEEQELLALIPPPLTEPSSTHTVSSLLEHVKDLTKKHGEHISNCRQALHKARYGRADTMEIDASPEADAAHENEEKYEWKMRVEVDDQAFKDQPAGDADEVPPSANPIIRALLGFMKDGKRPSDQPETQT